MLQTIDWEQKGNALGESQGSSPPTTVNLAQVHNTDKKSRRIDALLINYTAHGDVNVSVDCCKRQARNLS